MQLRCKQIGLALILVGVLGGVWVLQSMVLFPIKQFRITADFKHLDHKHVQQALDPLSQTGFFSFQTAELAAAVQALPWVKSVSIKRVWPDSLQIHITEQVPVARWNQDSLLTAEGEIFTPQSIVGFENLPFLQGAEGTAKSQFEDHQKVRRILQALGRDIKRFSIGPNGSWELVLDNDMLLLLGHEQPFERVKRFARVYQQVFGSHANDAKRVDLRYAHDMSVLWRHRH